jgi:NAD(P)-dependent dehydrogenase (short-subunit alcohol dehydrogenase family)
MATRFAAEGATVALADVNAQALTDAAGTIADAHAAKLRTDVVDVTDSAQVDAWITGITADLGRLDVLVNNAGIYQRAKLLDTDLAMYRRIIDVNQVGVFLGMRAVAPTMISQGAGSIVNISSVAGLRGSPGGFAYGASKFAVTGMTKSASRELARHGVRVNSIHPGMIETEMMDVVTGGNTERHDRFAASVPLKRPAEPAEVARLALFLASDDSSYCTGSEFVVDGGMTAV